MLVFYTDGVTETKNRLGEELGMERLSATVRGGCSLSAHDLMSNIYNAAADFCGDQFDDDVTILVVKCNFDTPRNCRFVTGKELARMHVNKVTISSLKKCSLLVRGCQLQVAVSVP